MVNNTWYEWHEIYGKLVGKYTSHMDPMGLKYPGETEVAPENSAWKGTVLACMINRHLISQV